MNRKTCLSLAESAVCVERAECYGAVEDNFGEIAKLWSVYTGAEIESRDVAAMMVLLKIARAKSGRKDDNWVDIAGYAACGAEIDGSKCTSGS